MKNITKNYTLELFKLFSSYMVVFIHVLFYGNLGIAMDALARFAVPLFFIVSGFYSYQIPAKKIKKRAVNIFCLYLFSSSIYTLYNIARAAVNTSTTVSQYFENYLNFKTLTRLLLFNVPISSGHLWFLLALLYTYAVVYVVNKLAVKENSFFLVSFILLLLHLLLGEGFSFFGKTVPLFLVRNFLLMGIPFFGIGMFIRKHEKAYRDIPNYISLLCLVIGIAETLLSRKLFGKNELYVGSVLILFTIVVTFIKYSNKTYPSFLMALSNCSTYVYVFHLLVNSALTVFCLCLGINYHSATFELIRPILICFITTIVAYIINEIKSICQCKKHLNTQKTAE